MRILLVNKFYYRRGGDCIYTINLEKLLKENGHEVAVFSMQFPENIETEWSDYFPSQISFKPGLGMIEAFRRPLGSSEVKKKFNRLLNDFKPDIVHANNIHSQLSPIILEIAKENGIKTVWTLHDYKLICPRYDCLRNDKTVCEECFKDPIFVKKYSCMKNSRLASYLAYKEARKWNRGKVESFTDNFICPSHFMRDKMIQAGFSSNKLHVIHNFISANLDSSNIDEKEDYYCYVGRLSHEKGTETLIKAASKLPYKVKIVGGGPLEEHLKQIATDNIEFAGFKQWDELKEIVSKAKFTVIPSEWYENNPLSIIESLCLGTPVLGSSIGGIPELIEENVNGMTFIPGDTEDLEDKITKMWSSSFDYKNISQNAISMYDKQDYLRELLKIYNSSLASST